MAPATARRASRFAVAGMLAAGSLLALAPAASADSGPGSGGGGSGSGSGATIATGSCSANSTWKLKAKPDNRRLEVEFEVDQNVNGQTWNVVITDNGTQVFAGTATTVAPSGSFEVKRRVTDQAGVDNFTATASNPVTGETCTGSVSR